MEIEKIYMKMEEEDMRSYLEQTVSNFAKWNSQNSRWKFWAQMGKNFKWYVIFKFFTIYRNFKVFWNFLPTLYSFWSFLTILDRFGLIWWCRSPFWAPFDRGFDPFVLILGIMSKLAYRLGFTSICNLHDLMTVSL